MNDLTIVSCFYNTPELLLPFFQSFFKHNKEKPNFLISDNSLDDQTQNLLEKYNIPYIRNKGLTHHESVDLLLSQVKTRYVLLVDSDILFKSSITKLYEKFKSSEAVLGGELQGSRGGFDLYDRIVPWFCFIDNKVIQEEHFKFFIPAKHDFHTEWNEPNRIALRPGKKNYDVGAEFYEQVIKTGYFVYILKENQTSNYYTHFEGMTWRKEDKNLHFVQMAKEVSKKYEAYCRAQNLSIVGINL